MSLTRWLIPGGEEESIYLPTPHNKRIIRQQQIEMNPPNPPPAGTNPMVAAQMQIL
jgi:hypothetical protein